MSDVVLIELAVKKAGGSDAETASSAHLPSLPALPPTLPPGHPTFSSTSKKPTTSSSLFIMSSSIEDVEKAGYNDKAVESNVQVLPADDRREDDVLVDVHSGIVSSS